MATNSGADVPTLQGALLMVRDELSGPERAFKHLKASALMDPVDRIEFFVPELKTFCLIQAAGALQCVSLANVTFQRQWELQNSVSD